MKKILSFLIVCLTVSVSYSQTNLTVASPANNGGLTTLRAPNGTTGHTTLRGHIIITQAELAGIPTGTVIDGLGFLYDTGASTPAGGNIQFYLENTTDATNLKSTTWATAIGTMTSVFNGTYNIPTTAGATGVTTNGSFTYTGGGLYVAYDYLGTTFAITAATYLCNTNITGGTVVDVSATATPPAILTLSSSWRPEIQFTFANPFTNNIKVDGLFAGQGQDNILLGGTQDITTSITNISSGALTNVPVTLNITGANPYTNVQTVASLAPGASTFVSFTAVPKTNTGNQTVVVNVPPDQQTANDTYTLSQDVYCDTVGYAYGDSITGGLGYDTGAGILANLLVIPTGAPITIPTVIPTITTEATSVGKSIVGVILNSAGVVIDSTANYVIATADLGNEVSLNFINGAMDFAGDSIYYGFRQIANAVGYFPLATQDITGIVPVDKFCGFSAGGGGYANYTTFGIFLIAAELKPDFGFTSNAVNGVVCAGTPLTVSVNSGFGNYDFVVDGTSIQNGAGTSYTYTPTTTTTAVVTTSIGVCPVSDSIVATQATAVTSSLSAGICPGTTYMFNGQSLTTSGTYMDTIPSSAGCDSIITLTLGDLQPSTASVTADFCTGDTYMFFSQSLTSAGNYTETIPNAAGCDSVITLTLSELIPTTSTLAVTECAVDYLFGGQTLTSSGTYTDVIMNAAGCDSTITLNLTLNTPVSATTTQSGSQLTAVVTPASATIQWVDCPAYTAIAGETGVMYQPAAITGSYAVVATGTNGCADTSACVSIDQTGIEEIDLSATVQLFPNPAVDVIHISSLNEPIMSYKVFDINGREILNVVSEGGKLKMDILINEFAKGTYKLEVHTQQHIIMKSFVKK